MLAPISWRVPPRHYGPWEQFVSLLTEGLVGRGVDVTLFATADSSTPFPQEPAWRIALFDVCRDGLAGHAGEPARQLHRHDKLRRW